MSFREVWYLTHYNEVVLKTVRYLKEVHGTVSSRVCFQFVVGIFILQGLDKCDSDRSQMIDLNQNLCSVKTKHTDISEIYQR